MSNAQKSLDHVNALGQDRFVTLFGDLFEGSPWIAADAWHAHPFADVTAMYRAFQDVINDAPPERQLALIQAHPDLVGRAARAGTLTPSSAQEQAAAGLALDRLSAEDSAAFDRLNTAYRDRFGFPFVICARENKKDAILAGFAARLDNDREREIAVALDEIAKIGWYRLVAAVHDDAMNDGSVRAHAVRLPDPQPVTLHVEVRP